MSTLLDTPVSLPRVSNKHSDGKPYFYGFTPWTAADAITNCFRYRVRPISGLPFCPYKCGYRRLRDTRRMPGSSLIVLPGRTDGVDGKYLANIVGKENKKEKKTLHAASRKRRWRRRRRPCLASITRFYCSQLDFLILIIKRRAGVLKQTKRILSTCVIFYRRRIGLWVDGRSDDGVSGGDHDISIGAHNFCCPKTFFSGAKENRVIGFENVQSSNFPWKTVRNVTHDCVHLNRNVLYDFFF